MMIGNSLFLDEEARMSPDMATAELSRRLLNILSKTDPVECEEELKKLKEELSAKSKCRV